MVSRNVFAIEIFHSYRFRLCTALGNSPASLIMSGTENASIKLKGVAGYKGRQNDVLYCHPLEKTQRPSVVVYFGGDIQVIYSRSRDASVSPR